ncbi:MAG: CDP-alcohol phosphatidyltransferase family protein [candidate division Zixibacteria bacterium]|nr:CDP-alcohol phosphatidyltransferase family protein [candidate division Zixibacteria bacterium]
MEKLENINLRELFQIQNLMSLLRIFLTPFIGYYLWVNSNEATIIIVILLIVAGASDYFDGYLARKLNRQTALGLMLDPLADKAFATILILELIFLRDFPLWLAGMVFFRDIIIVVGASLMMKRKNLIPFSIISGKYYFAALAVLISSYIIKFPFGIQLCLYLTVILFVISSYEYARNYYLLAHGRKLIGSSENVAYMYFRGGVSVAFWIVYLYKLFEQFLGWSLFN